MYSTSEYLHVTFTPPPVRWDRRTMSQSVHRTSLAVTGCRKEIAKDRDNVAKMSRDVARCRNVVACRARSLEFTKRHQSRRLRSTLRHYNRIPPDWGVGPVPVVWSVTRGSTYRTPERSPNMQWLWRFGKVGVSRARDLRARSICNSCFSLAGVVFIPSPSSTR